MRPALPPLLLTLLLAALPAAAAEGLSEDELFSTAEVVTQAAAAPAAEEDKRSVGFSGEVLSVMQDVVYSSNSAGSFDSYIVGNLMLDARLKNGVKAFANLETNYSPKSDETKSALREAFVDFNLDHKVYFRTGKQVLQWGRCMLWNPTDLINVEKKTFIRKLGYRDGAYGLKLHLPFGTKYNIYGFVDTGHAQEDRDLGGALKFEMLAGRTEMAVSGWAKRDRRPVFGYDLSSRLGDVDIAGELSVARRDNTRYMRESGGSLSTYLNDEDWPVRASVNFSKGFRLGNFNDRLTVATEFFYNQNGYTKSPFNDRGAYTFTGPLSLLLPAGTKTQFLAANGLYEPNYMARYYGAVFTTISRFIITDMTLNLNYIQNLNDNTGVLSAGTTYKNINDFSAGALLSAYLGPRGGEYTFAGARFMAQLTAGISF